MGKTKDTKKGEIIAKADEVIAKKDEIIAKTDEVIAKTDEIVRKDVKVRFSLVWKILLISVVPFLILAVVLTVIGVTSMRSSLKEEAMDKLQSVLVSVNAAMDAVSDADYSIDVDGNLYKGSYNLTEDTELLDSLVEGTNEDVTIFYGNVRRATTLVDDTTGERIVGTEASDEVYEAVVEKGQDYEAEGLVINGHKYYAYYTPISNSDGAIIGMLFCGVPSTDINSFLVQKTMTMIVSAVVIGVIALIIIIVNVILIRQGLLDANDAVVSLAGGNLKTKISSRTLKRGDELGMIAHQIETLQKELNAVMLKVKDSASVLMDSGKELNSMASQTSATADEISHAVEDISKGAVSQAEEIETASARIEEMGSVLQNIVKSVDGLDNLSGEMKDAGDKSVEIVRDLSGSNDKTMDAVDRIGKQVNATNESANKIREAIEIITSIAEETNLLSLNASIEAARAGEQGRGFAVVANQIQKLAEQSNESAQKIAQIIQELIADSENTVSVMGEVQKIVDEQQTKLQQTRNQFQDVSRGIDTTKEEADEIKQQTDVCDTARSKVVDVISDLSAISEENAAATQETTASMEELNATINLLAESAGSLQDLSEALEKEIGFFQF